MNPESELEQIRRDFEARQHSPAPGSNLKISIAAESSPWNQNHGKRSLVPALLFLLFTIGIVAIPFLNDFEDGTIVAFVIALGPLFMCYLLIRGYALHHRDGDQDRNK